MLRTSTDARTRAQKYADSRWWTDGVKTVGYAIHRPEFQGDNRAPVYSVEILGNDGWKTTRWICVVTETDGAGYIYECSGIYSPNTVQFSGVAS